MKTGIVIFAHGSSIASANEAVRGVAEQVARQGGFELVEAAYLEQGTPDLKEAVERVISRGASRVLVVPYFLTLGLHLQRDLPRIVDGISLIHPNVEIRVAPPLDGHPGMAQALIERARDGERTWNDGEAAGSPRDRS